MSVDWDQWVGGGALYRSGCPHSNSCLAHRCVRCHDIVLEKLDSIQVLDIKIDSDITSVVQFLQKQVEGTKCEGKPIRFKLLAGPWENNSTPKMTFSCKDISVKDLLIITCACTALDYRIEETTVYLESEK